MPTRTSQRKAATTKQIPKPTMPPPPAAAPSGMTRRSKRVVESVSPEAEVEPELAPGEPSDEEEADGEGPRDLVGIDYVDPEEEEEEDEGEDMDIDDEYLIDETTAATPDETPTPTPSVAPATSGIKLKLTLNGKNKNVSSSSSSTTTPVAPNAEAGPSSVRTAARGKRHAKADAAAFEDDASQASASTNKGKSMRASKRVKLDVESEKEDVSDRDELMGGGDTSRLTARQRARQGDGGFGEHLMMLPEDTGKKVQLSDLEKQARKEENARRRKLQMDQKMENDRNDVINRLLKAQTGKTRRNVAQAEGTPMSLNDADDGNADAKTAAVVPGMLRFVSSIRSGKFEMFVSAPPGKEQAIALEASRPEPVVRSTPLAHCGVKGCGEKRKYRSVLDFEKGGCSMSHLKLVEQSLRGV